MRIIQSARKHGIKDEDMLHAVRHPLEISPPEDNFTMYSGAAREGQLLEVGVLGVEGDDPVIIHADRDRRWRKPRRAR
jgi:hypothetical protein